MSGSTQTTIDGREAEADKRTSHVNGLGAVLWEVGADERVRVGEREAVLCSVHRKAFLEVSS